MCRVAAPAEDFKDGPWYQLTWPDVGTEFNFGKKLVVPPDTLWLCDVAVEIGPFIDDSHKYIYIYMIMIRMRMRRMMMMMMMMIYRLKRMIFHSYVT